VNLDLRASGREAQVAAISARGRIGVKAEFGGVSLTSIQTPSLIFFILSPFFPAIIVTARNLRRFCPIFCE